MSRLSNYIDRVVFAVVVATLVAASTVAAQADVLVTNLSEPLRDSTPIANPEYWGAQSFITGNSPLRLTSIDIRGGNSAGALVAVSELRRATGINYEVDTTAGGLIGTFSIPDLTGGLGVRTFVPNSLIELDPNTAYWFILGASQGTFDWSYADTGLFSGPGFLGNYSDSSDAGASWILRGNDFPYFIQVNVASVPEPAFGPLLLSAAIGLSMILNRRRERALRFISS